MPPISAPTATVKNACQRLAKTTQASSTTLVDEEEVVDEEEIFFLD